MCQEKDCLGQVVGVLGFAERCADCIGRLFSMIAAYGLENVLWIAPCWIDDIIDKIPVISYGKIEIIIRGCNVERNEEILAYVFWIMIDSRRMG